MSVFHENMLIGASGQVAAGGISRSLRFNSSDSAYLSRTPASAGNRRTWTFSAWVKRSLLGSSFQTIIGAGTGGNAEASIRFNSDDTLEFYAWTGGYNARLLTTQVFRDVSAWYHLVAVFDTPNATADQRIRLYVNGIEITTFSSRTNPTQNYDGYFNNSISHTIGDAVSGASPRFFNGYLAECHLIDGQALTPSSFTEVSATTGQLVPKAYTGTFGTNGFWLKFSDNSNNTAATLGKDYSPNGNNWTPFNLQTTTGGPTSVAAASGALPIYNTTDTYGTTKGTGTRTDSNSSSIVLAIPMDGANNGTTFTDESATIKGSGSAKTITRFNTTTVTAQSKFYGSSGSYDGSTKYLRLDSSADFDFGSGAFTVEAWVYLNALPTTDSWPGSFANWMNIAAYGTASVADGWQFRIGQTILAFGTNSDSTAVSATHGIGTGKWNHLAATRNGNVYTLWVNGVSIGSATYTANNPGTGAYLWVGTETAQGAWLNGYLQDLRVYKGVAKYTSNFNPPSSTQNPTIAAGNDSLVDTPTSYGTDTGAGGEVRGNYATLNPLANGGLTLTNGNLDMSRATASWKNARGTIAYPASGKWYWEFTCSSNTDSTNGPKVGIVTSQASLDDPGLDAFGWAYLGYNGTKWNNGSSSAYGATWTNGDVISTVFDADAGTLVFYKNGVSQGTAFSGLTAGPYFPVAGIYGTGSGSLNFGQRPFAYTAPSGFKALCDTNLPAPVVAKPSTVMDVKLYTGNASSNAITGLGFSPDLVWIKSRSSANWHNIFDVVRGNNRILYSNATNAEEVETTASLTSFDSTGFTLSGNGSSGVGNVNGNGTTYAAWTWDAGSSTVTNTQGSITSSVRANPSAGFSICTFTTQASGSGQTVGHGLGVAPSLIIQKIRNVGGSSWFVYHTSLGAGNYILFDTSASVASSTAWNSTSPTSSVWSLGSTWAGSYSAVAYCWTPVAGYANAFSFTGNGSSDGPMVWLGFRPRLILLKRTDSTSYWHMYDTARNTYNVADANLWANGSDAEISNSAYNFDLLSNGFKVRTSDAARNASGGTYVGFAWAESPFQYARAR